MLYRDSAEQASAAFAELATYSLTMTAHFYAVRRAQHLLTHYVLRRAPPPPSSRRGCKVRSRRSR